MWWLLPLIGAAGGALTNLNNPKQTWKNTLIGAGLGAGANLIPGATEGVAGLFGLGGTKAGAGAGIALSKPAVATTTGQAINPAQFGLLTPEMTAGTFMGGVPMGGTSYGATTLGTTKSLLTRMLANPLMRFGMLNMGNDMLSQNQARPATESSISLAPQGTATGAPINKPQLDVSGLQALFAHDPYRYNRRY